MARDSSMTEPPFFVLGADRPGRWIVTCDHASNRVPEDLSGDLGLAPEDMARHIAFDPGAAGVTRHLAELLGSPAVLSNFSRLVIDPNRGELDPTLVMKLYDGTIIPRNRDVDAIEVERRLDAYYRPYHGAIDALTASRAPEAIVSIHSFTPQFKGRAHRPWQIGILSASDRRLSDPLLRLLREDCDLIVGDNEPYTGSLAGDAMDRHGIQPGRQHTLIEIRNDLITTDSDQRAWAERLAPHLEAALDEAEV